MLLGDSLKVIRAGRWFRPVAIVVGVTIASCSAPAAPPTDPPSLAAHAVLGMKAPSSGTTIQTSGPDKLPMDEIFPPGGKGREIALNNCIQCHSIIRIVWGPRTEEEWQSVKFRHSERVRGLNDDSFNAIFVYLKESFSPDKPYPRLPQWYLESVNP